MIYRHKGAQEKPALADFSIVLPPGIEPGALVPQTSILSIKLRKQVRKQVKHGATHIYSRGTITLKSKSFQYLHKQRFLQ